MLETTVLLVRLGSHLYAMPISAVEEVLPDLPIEPLPSCPDYVCGVIYVRGHLIPVLSAARRLGLSQHHRADEPNIVCLRSGKRLVGVEFDEVLDLMDMGAAKILPAHDLGAADKFFKSVFEIEGRLVRLLDPDRLAAVDVLAEAQG